MAQPSNLCSWSAIVIVHIGVSMHADTPHPRWASEGANVNTQLNCMHSTRLCSEPAPGTLRAAVATTSASPSKPLINASGLKQRSDCVANEFVRVGVLSMDLES